MPLRALLSIFRRVLHTGSHDAPSLGVRRIGVAWLSLCAVALFRPPIALAVDSRGAGEDSRLTALAGEIAASLHLSECEVVRLEVDTRADVPLRVEVPIDGVRCTLDLEPRSVRAPGFRLLVEAEDGTFIESKAGPSTTLHGFVVEDPTSEVVAGLTPSGLHACIVSADGARHWIEPAVDHVAGPVPHGTHVIWAEEASTPPPARCATEPVVSVRSPGHDAADEDVQVGRVDARIDDDGRSTAAAGDRWEARLAVEGGPRSNELWVAQLAVEAEYYAFAEYGSEALVASKIEFVTNVMNLQFERDVQIRHELTAIVVRTRRDYDYSRDLRIQFRDRWNTFHGDIARDMALMWIGIGLGGQAASRGCQGGTVCDVGEAYAIIGTEGYPSLEYLADVSAHEIGHMWGAQHCDCWDPPSTMNPWVTGANRFVGSPLSECGRTSIDEITRYRDAIACLESRAGGGIVRNDFFCSAVPADHGTWGFSTIGASTDGPAAGCGSPGADIWYTFTPTCDGGLILDTCRSDFDTVLVVYSGSDCPRSFGTEIACNDDVAPGTECILGRPSPVLTSRVEFPTRGGETYLIRVAGFNGAVGTGLLRLQATDCPRPSNDSCERARRVANGEPVSFQTIGATTDGPLEQVLCSNLDDSQVSNDVWFRFVTPCGGTMRASVCDSDFDTKLAIYHGECSGLANDSATACNDDNGPVCPGVQSSVEWQSQFSGTTYLIRIGGYHGQMGRGTLVVESVACDPEPVRRFNRGDVNADSRLEISDAVYLLSHLFSGGPEPTCVKSADVNDSGVVDMSDAIWLLSFLFLGGPAPPAPHRTCGLDLTPDGLTCILFSPCIPR